MDQNLTRRELLAAGAAGTVAAGIAMVAGPATAGAQVTRVGGIHIHTNLKQTGGPPLSLNLLMDLNVYGPDDDMSGGGWDVTAESEGSPNPSHPDPTGCLFTQRGSVDGDVVRLTGYTYLATLPPNLSQLVTTEANLATGKITWTFGDSFVLEGTGVVVRI
jgi:hypothetical protein